MHSSLPAEPLTVYIPFPFSLTLSHIYVLCSYGFHDLLELLLLLSLAQDVVKEAGAAMRGKLKLFFFTVLCNSPPPLQNAG